MDQRRYPMEMTERLRLDDGRTVLVRPIRPGDEELVQFFVRSLSPRSRYQRFHGSIKELDSRTLRCATHVDYHRHFALVAVTLDGEAETEIGAARYVMRSDDASAEFALVVADNWQRRGLGQRLLERLMAFAAKQGVRRFESQVLADNEAILLLSARLGYKATRVAGDAHLTNVTKDLRGEPSPALA